MWTEELPRHSKKKCTTRRRRSCSRRKGIKKYKKEGDRRFTEEGRIAEITVDAVLHARAKIAEDKVKGPEASIVTEMTKENSLRKTFFGITKCFQARFMDQEEAPTSWKTAKLLFLRNPDAEPKTGIRSCRATALTLAMSK